MTIAGTSASTSQNAGHEALMLRCIELARIAEGRTSPNPLVGSVVLDAQGQVAGEGYHHKAGDPHAEVLALEQAGEAARGGTLYVNLEPCCHHGRTPPCTERVIASGVKSVVIGMRDPNPKVDGGGMEALRQKGIEVSNGILEAECRGLNRAFIKRVTTGLPWVTLKLATTLDARIADRYGTSQWITGPEARKYVHQLRNTYDVVLIGSNTAVKDDPQLNVREVEGGRDPVRAVVDPNLRILPDSRICKKDSGGSTLLFAKQSAIDEKRDKFPEHVTLVPTDLLKLPPNCPDLIVHSGEAGSADIPQILRYLVEKEHNSVLCEGGGKLAASLLKLGLIDEIIWFIAPKLLLDGEGIPALNLNVTNVLSEAVELASVQVSRMGQDIAIHALVKRPGSAASQVAQPGASGSPASH